MNSLCRSMLFGLVTCTVGSGLAVAAEAPDCTNYRKNRHLDAREIQLCEALSIKQRYLEKGTFVDEAPAGSTGQASDVRKQMTSRFASSGASEIRGSVSIGGLTGQLRLTLANTSNTLYYGRKVRVSGTASVTGGRLEIYSPVDVDFWEMATLFVDAPVRNEPAPKGLALKGYLVTEISSGPATRFSAELIAVGGDFRLLLHAPDGEASGIEIEIGDG